MLDPIRNESAPGSGQVWLLAENPREPELVFDFPFDEELNEAVKRLPGRWFDWRRKHWRVRAQATLAKPVQELLAQFPALVAAPEVVAWLSDSDRWRALVSVAMRDGAGVFVMRTVSGDPPRDLIGATEVSENRHVFAFDADGASTSPSSGLDCRMRGTSVTARQPRKRKSAPVRGAAGPAAMRWRNSASSQPIYGRLPNTRSYSARASVIALCGGIFGSAGAASTAGASA